MDSDVATGGPGPFFSIVTPAYNRAAFLPVCIKSVLAQTFGDWEYIIVDDCSNDNSEEVVKSFDDPRIVYLRNDVNRERGYSRNRGILAARGQYICFLDSDDWFEPNHLDVFYKHILSNNLPNALMFTRIYATTPGGSKLERPQPRLGDQNRFDYLMRYTFVPTMACMPVEIAREFLFDTSINGLEDLDLWLRVVSKYELVQINVFTHTYLSHPEAHSHAEDPDKPKRELEFFKRIFSKQELQHLLPVAAKNYLLGKTYYFLALSLFDIDQRWAMYRSIFSSFYFLPGGYNEKANMTMLVMAIYKLPFFGGIVKALKNREKK